MTQSIIYPASRVKAGIMLAGSLAFVAFGIWILPRDSTLGWSCIGLFGLFSVVFLAMLRPGAVTLTLNEQGFEMKSLFNSRMTHWTEVEYFTEANINHSKMIGVMFREGSPRYSKVSGALAGFHTVIPMTYAIKRDALLAQLCAMHAQYGPSTIISKRAS